jgi:magnesium-transporting ATPase (P-type)
MPSLLDALDVNPTTGITARDLKIRDVVFGSNFKPEMVRTPFCNFVMAALEDFMLRILIVCAIISISIDMGTAEPEELGHAWVEGFAILVAVAVVSLVSAVSDYQKEGQFLKQQKLEENSKVVSWCRLHRLPFIILLIY